MGSGIPAASLWQTERDATAGRTAIGPRVRQLLQPLMAAQFWLLAAGEVVASDLGRTPVTSAAGTAADSTP